MAFDVTPPEIVGFSRDRIVWKFESDLAGSVSGSLAQNLLVLTGPLVAGTRVPIRWGDTVLSLMAATVPDATGAQFPAGDGSATYATTLAAWLSKNYFLNKNFTIEAATHQGSPALFFYARENGLGYDFNLANFPGGSVSNLVPGVANNEPLNPSVFVEVWLGNESGMQYQLVYEGPQGLDAARQASFDVAPILHTHLRAETADYALPEAERCIYSTRRYYLRYAHAGGEQFSIGQLETAPTHVVTMGGFSELSGGPVSVQGTFQGATPADDRLLMVQDRTRWVRVDEPLYVSWINWRTSGKNIHARATVTYIDDTTVTTNTATLNNVAQYDRLRFGVGFGQLNMAALPKQVKEYTVQLRDDTGPVSEPLRCLVDVSFRQYVRYFGHVNSYGGLEIIKTFGKGSGEWKLFRETAEQVLPYELKSTDGQFLDWNLKYQESFEVATGFLPKRQQAYFLDFFLSPLKHRIVNGVGYAVNVVSESIQHGTDGQNLFGFAFKFQYSRQLDAVSEQDLVAATSPAQQIPPGVQSPGSIIIPTPGSDWLGIIDPYPIQGSSNPVASGGVWSRLALKQDKLTLGTTLQYLRGDGSLGSFATAVAALESDPTVPAYAKSLTSKAKVLSDLTTIDGVNSGLDADLWRGQTPAQMTVWKSLQWAAAITLSLSGAVTGTAQVDGSGNVNMVTTLTAPGLSGTPNRLAKFSLNGTNVVDSTITEVGGLVSIVGSNLQVAGPDGFGRFYGKNQVSGNPITALLVTPGFGGSTMLEIGGGTTQGEAVSSIRFRLGTAGALGAGNIVGTWNSVGLGINAPNPTHMLHVGGDVRFGVVKIETIPGEAPLITTSTVKVNNLHADLLDGWHGSYYQDAANLNAGVFPIQRHPLSGVAGGSYTRVDVNSYGHITSGSNPTTLAGYGITDAVSALGSYVNPIWLVSISASKVTGLPAFPTIAGTTNYVARFTAPSTLGIGTLYDNGTSVGIGRVPDSYVCLDLQGNLRVGYETVVGSGPYGANQRVASLLMGTDSSDRKNSIYMGNFYPYYQFEIGSGKQTHTSDRPAILTTDGNGGPGSLFEGQYGVLTLVSRADAGANGIVRVLTGADRKKTATFNQLGDIQAFRYLNSSQTAYSSPQTTGLRVAGLDGDGNVKASYAIGEVAILSAPANITGQWTFNVLVPTSSVTPVNAFDLVNKAYVDYVVGNGGTGGGGGGTDITPSWVNGITQANINAWNAANTWGNHALAGYQSVAGMSAYQSASPLLSSLPTLGLGFWCKHWSGTIAAARTLTQGIGIIITNPDGSLGDPIIGLADIHGGLFVNGISVTPRGQVVSIQPWTYANNILPLLPASVLHDSRPPQFSAIPPLSATAGQPYNFTLNLAPYKTSYHNTANMQIKAVAIGPKSAWLVKNFSGLSVTLSGTPNTSGEIDLIITVADNNGNETTLVPGGNVIEGTVTNPASITARLYNMADGSFVNLVSGQSYTYHPQWQLRFYVVGTHNQVSQGLTGVGPDASWGISDAKPGGVTTEDSNHGVFIGSAEGTGRTAGTYTFKPKAHLAGAVVAGPTFTFTLVEEQTGGGNTNLGTAYFFNDTTDTVVGAIPSGGATFALPPSWDARYDHGPINANGLWMELHKTGASGNPVFARGYGMVANSTGSVFLFDGLNDSTNLGAEQNGLVLKAGFYTLKVIARMNGVDINTDIFPLTITASGGEMFTKSRMGFTNPGGDPNDGVALIQQNKTLGFNSLGTSFAYDFRVDADLLDANWPEYNHVTNSSAASSGSPHTFDALVHRAYLDDQEVRVMIGLNQLWRDINGRNGITAYYGTDAMHLQPDGSPTCADNYPGTPGDPNDPPFPVPLTSCVSLSHPAIYPLALKKCRLFAKRYKPAIQQDIVPLFGIGIDPNAEAQGLFEVRNGFGLAIGQPKGDFNPYAIAEFKARYPQHAGADNNAIANASYSTALGSDWQYFECDKIRRFEWRLIADLIAEFPWLADKKFWMIDAGSHADALSHIRRTFAVHSRLHPINGGFIKANDNPYKYYLFDYLWSAGLYGAITYEEITPMDGAINNNSKSLMVEYATRCRKLGIGLSWLTQGIALNGIFQQIATEAGLYDITTRQSPNPADVITLNLNLSAIIAGGTGYLENQWTAAGGSATKFVKFIVNNDKALPGDDEPPDGGGGGSTTWTPVVANRTDPNYLNLGITGTSGNWRITDNSPFSPNAGYQRWYVINGVVHKLGNALNNFEWNSNEPITIHKQHYKATAPNFNEWNFGPSDTSYNINGRGDIGGIWTIIFKQV